MLKTRVLTALGLLAVFIPAALFLPDKGWAVLISAVIGVAAWEWAGLAGFGRKARVGYGLCMFALLAVLAWFAIEKRQMNLMEYRMGHVEMNLMEYRMDHVGLVQTELIIFSLSVLIFWFMVVPLWFRFRWQLKGVFALILGALVLYPAGLIVALTSSDDKIFLLSVLAIAWVADIAAYFAGRQFGKRKLAPSISPGKTWEGALGAVVAVQLYLGFTGLYPGTVFAGFFIALALTAACILGDLFESLLKRQAGIKDSSNLLPGHGGVLDRIDSLLALLPVSSAVMAVLWLSGLT